MSQAEASHYDDCALDHDASGPNEYTRRHREAWPLLVRSPGVETFEASELTSWRDLWGRLVSNCIGASWAETRTSTLT